MVKGLENFNIVDMVVCLSIKFDGFVCKVFVYIDIGEVEDFCIYWMLSWKVLIVDGFGMFDFII